MNAGRRGFFLGLVGAAASIPGLGWLDNFQTDQSPALEEDDVHRVIADAYQAGLLNGHRELFDARERQMQWRRMTKPPLIKGWYEVLLDQQLRSLYPVRFAYWDGTRFYDSDSRETGSTFVFPGNLIGWRPTQPFAGVDVMYSLTPCYQTQKVHRYHGEAHT